ELVPTGQPIDVEEKPEGEPPVIMAESFTTQMPFSARGVTGMTVSNSNGVQKYTLDPSMGFETNMVHFDVAQSGATIFGEEMEVKTQLQPEMTTPPELTKEIEKHPDIKFTNADADAFKKKA
ncbi:hypothetical protein LCGC14_1550770, partial [marine sediment metagenome]